MTAKRSKDRHKKKEAAEKWETLVGWGLGSEIPDDCGIEAWSKRHRDTESLTERERRLAVRDWERYLCSVLRKCTAIENVATFIEQSLSESLRPRPKPSPALSLKDSKESPSSSQQPKKADDLPKRENDGDADRDAEDADDVRSRPKTATGVTESQPTPQPLIRSNTSCSQHSTLSHQTTYPSRRVKKLIRFSLSAGSNKSEGSSSQQDTKYLNEGEEEAAHFNPVTSPVTSVSKIAQESSPHKVAKQNNPHSCAPRLAYTRSQTWQNSSVVSYGNAQKLNSSPSAPNGVTGCPSGTFVTALNELRQKMTSQSDSQLESQTRSPNPAENSESNRTLDANTAGLSVASFQTGRTKGNHTGNLTDGCPANKQAPKPVALVLKRVGLQEGEAQDNSQTEPVQKEHSQSAPVNLVRERTNSLRQNALLNLQLALQTAKRYRNSVPDNFRTTEDKENSVGGDSGGVNADNVQETVYTFKASSCGVDGRLNGSSVPLRSLLDLPAVDNVPNNKTGRPQKEPTAETDGTDATTAHRLPYEESLLVMRDGIKLLRLKETRPSCLGPPAFRPQHSKTPLQRAKETTQKRLYGQMAANLGQTEEDISRTRWRSSTGHLYAPGTSATPRCMTESRSDTDIGRLSHRRKGAPTHAETTLLMVGDSREHGSSRFNDRVMQMARRAASGEDLRQTNHFTAR